MARAAPDLLDDGSRLRYVERSFMYYRNVLIWCNFSVVAVVSGRLSAAVTLEMGKDAPIAEVQVLQIANFWGWVAACSRLQSHLYYDSQSNSRLLSRSIHQHCRPKRTSPDGHILQYMARSWGTLLKRLLCQTTRQLYAQLLIHGSPATIWGHPLQEANIFLIITLTMMTTHRRCSTSSRQHTRCLMRIQA